MRQVLIDYFRARSAEKRGGKLTRVSFDELRVAGSSGDLSDRHATLLIALDASLERLSDLDSRQGRVVECRFFGGMTIPDTAEALGVSRAGLIGERGCATRRCRAGTDDQRRDRHENRGDPALGFGLRGRRKSDATSPPRPYFRGSRGAGASCSTPVGGLQDDQA